MAKVNKAVIRFAPSTSPDVVGYKLYIEEDPSDVTYNSTSFDLGSPPLDNDTGLLEVDLATLPGMTTYDGIYGLGVVAMDDVLNESSMSIKMGISLDFVAPDPPGAIEVIIG